MTGSRFPCVGLNKDALPRLPKRQQEVIRLRLFEKLSTAEIAGRLGCSEGAVKMMQSRAVYKLQLLIQKAVANYKD